VWDVLAAGGFLLTNYQTEIPDYFEIAGDLDVYENLDDLKEKIKFYLRHEDIRRQIAENGREKVRKYHTYYDRIGTILEILNEQTP
jgi:spore maturation protein CgeB